jgi:hypothetical protein
MIRQTLKNFGWLTAMATLVVTVVALSSTAVQAQNDWSLSISEKEDKLANPTDPMWDKWLMWDLGYQRMVERNAPYIELTNEATSTSPITEFHITIGDNNFNFGPVDGSNLIKLGTTTPGFNLSATTLNGAGDELVVTIGNGGLLPNTSVRFEIKLDIDPAYAATYEASFGASLPDFRTVLFDMNGIDVYAGTTNPSTLDNSQVFVNFTPGGQSTVATFEDEPVAAGQFFNNNIREYRAMDPVLIFQLDGTQIPEPTSFGLVLLGLAGFCLGSRRRSAVA